MKSRESTDELQAQRGAERRRAFLERLRAERQPRTDTRRRTKEETPSPLARQQQAARTRTVEQLQVLPTESQRQQEEARAAERVQARRLARETSADLQQQQKTEQEQLQGAKLLENKHLARVNQAERIEHEEQATTKRQEQGARQAEIRAAALREHQSLVQQTEAARVQRHHEIKASARQKQQDNQRAEARALALREQQRLVLNNEAARTQQQAELQVAAERKREAQQAEARTAALREQQQLALQTEVTRAQPLETRPPEKQSPDRRDEIASANASQEQVLAQQNEEARRQIEAEQRAARLLRKQEEQERQRAAAVAQAQEIHRKQLLQEEALRKEAVKRDRARAASERTGQSEAALSATQRSDRQQSAPRQALVARKVQVSARIAATSEATEAPTAQPTDVPLYLRTSGSFILDENGNAVNLRGVTIRGFDTAAPTGGQTFAAALALDDNNLAVMADVWHTNLVRLPFQAQTIISGNGTLSAADMLAGLDVTVATIIDGGAYALLSLEPPPGGSAPDANTHQAWQSLALRYQGEPRVLYEIFCSPSPLAANWLQQAATLVDEIRQQNPAAVIFLGSGKGGADVSGLPLLLPAGEPVENLIYTIAASTQNLPDPNDGKLRALAESYPVFASIWSDDGSDFGRSSARVADLFGRYGIGWAASNWNADPRLVDDAENHDFTPTGWGSILQHALALPAPVLLKDFPSLSSVTNAVIRPLSTNANYIVDEKGEPVTLRGISVRGLDTIAPAKDTTFPAALALDANNLAVITEVWHTTLVRLPFQAQTLLSGNGTLSAAEILAGLDLTVAAITSMGAYVLLSLEPPSGSGGAFVPDASTIQLWQILADHYKGNHGVLYELLASISPLPSNWLQFAANLVAAIRQRNSASVIFVGSGKGAADVTGLPLIFATGDPVFNIVYTVAASTQSLPSPDDGQLQALAESYPVFASIWLDDGSDFGRSSARVADLFTRYGIGWAASNWNAEPRLVADAAAHDFAPTGWGLVVGRALAQPIKPLLSAFS